MILRRSDDLNDKLNTFESLLKEHKPVEFESKLLPLSLDFSVVVLVVVGKYVSFCMCVECIHVLVPLLCLSAYLQRLKRNTRRRNIEKPRLLSNQFCGNASTMKNTDRLQIVVSAPYNNIIFLISLHSLSLLLINVVHFNVQRVNFA